MKKVTELLGRFINMLQEYDRELGVFFSKGVYYFCSADQSNNVSETSIAKLALVDRERDELRKLLIKLQHIKDCLCKDISRDVSYKIG